MPNIPYQQHWNHAVEQRYHPIAGPFNGNEVALFERVREYLSKTGARILTVGEQNGTSIYRLRSECETMEATAARIARQRHTRPHCKAS